MGLVLAKLFSEIKLSAGLRAGAIIAVFAILASITFLIFATFRYFYVIATLRDGQYPVDVSGPVVLTTCLMSLFFTSAYILRLIKKDERKADKAEAEEEKRKRTRTPTGIAADDECDSPLLDADDVGDSNQMAMLRLSDSQRHPPLNISTGCAVSGDRSYARLEKQHSDLLHRLDELTALLREDLAMRARDKKTA